MADTCLWRSWETRIDWTAYPTVAQDVRNRVTAFLQPVCAAIADLAVTLPDATDDDLIAVLGSHLLCLPGPRRVRTEAALAEVVVPRLVAALDSPDADPAAEARLYPVALRHEPRPQGEGPRGAVGDRGGLPRSGAPRAAHRSRGRRLRRPRLRGGGADRGAGRAAAEGRLAGDPAEAYHVM